MLSVISYSRVEESRRFCHPVKLTAMIYLKEALIVENYEACTGIIEIAREFGAEDTEIAEILSQRGGEKKVKSWDVAIRQNTQRRSPRRFI